MTQKTLLILRGVPASGKSTIALRYVEEQKYVRVNRDEIRAMLFGRYHGVDEHEVTKVEHTLIRRAFLAGRNVVSDNTNLNSRFVSKLLEIGREFNAQVEYQDVVVSQEEALRRDWSRGMNGERYVGGDAIKGFFRRHGISPDTGELPEPPAALREWRAYEPDLLLPEAYIVDTDGTVALMTNRGPYDTTRYADDAPNWPVINAVQALRNAGFCIVGVSGRSEEFRKVTEKWWGDVGLKFDLFLMRPSGDVRNDSEVKYDLFDQHIRQQYWVQAALDDRPRVLRMWRAIGVPTLQVGDGREF